VTVGELSNAELRELLRTQRFTLRIGPFLVRLRSVMPEVQAALALLYGAHEIDTGADGAHFVIRVDHPGIVRRFFRAQVQFTIDSRQPFFPLPASMAAPMLEAGLNWCIGKSANQFLVIHSATLERDGRALLMPAPPGSGKSTLCAALVARGWRLLSDEFALVDPATGMLVPVPRPVALKDASIDVIARWAPDALLGPSVVNNEGELVAYMRPPAASVRESEVTCRPGWIVLPQYVAGADTTATTMTRARALMHLADNSFNYNFHGRLGFERLAGIADRAPAVTLRYSRLDEGVEAVDRLARTSAP
jgi:HprK-related kinase A